MQVKINEKIAESKVELKITASAEDFKPHLEKAAKVVSKNKPLKGFRPGKAPLKVAIEAFGQERVVSEALQHAIPHLFVKAVRANKIEAIGRPSTTIEKADPINGITFTALVDILPKVKLADSNKIKASRRTVTVNDDAIDRELTHLAKLRSNYIDVARPAQQGDTVFVDFTVTIDGKEIDGGSSKNHPVHLGEGHFIPDFEKNLLGIATKDNREFIITFPANYPKPAIAGKEAMVKATAQAVQKRVAPKIDDAFAKSLGKFTDLKNLKDDLRKNLQLELEHKELDRLRGELAQGLAEESTFTTIPDSLTNYEIDHRLEELSQMLALQHKTIDDYLKQQNKTLEQVRSDMRETTIKSIKTSLALREFANKYKIEVSDTEVQEKLQEYLARFPQNEDHNNAADHDQLKTNLASTLRNQKALSKLEELAQISTTNESKPTH